MNRILQFCLAAASFSLAITVSIMTPPRIMAQSAPLIVKGTVTDPSGASVPDAQVFVKPSRGAELRVRTGRLGDYTVTIPQPGKYTVRVTAKGFALYQQDNVEIVPGMELNVQLSITAEAQVVDVTDEVKTVSTDPAS